MPQSLRSILGGSNRVRKSARQQHSRTGTSSASPRKKTSSSAKSSTPNASPRKPRVRTDGNEAETESAFEKRMDEAGTARLLDSEEALTLRDVVQAMRHVRSHMFSPVPEKGLHSTRAVELRNYQASMPPIVTTAHIQAVLGSPTRVEREAAELLRRGVIRRVRIERRGAMGETLIEESDLGGMVRAAGGAGLSTETQDRFLAFLRDNPTAQTLQPGSVTDSQADQLVRAGFLTSAMHSGARSTLHVRPEDRTTLTSIERISRHASGSVSAVGGANAIHLAGGGSGAPSLTRSSSSSSSATADLRIAVPGHGRHLKLSAAGIQWLREALGRTRWGECTESWLRERFDGGGLYGPRWKEFSGVRWDWVLGEAVGLGVVEIFETNSVGRGVRALGG